MSWANQAVIQQLYHVPAGLVWPFARRYVAGRSVEEALPILEELKDERLLTTVDVLGEHVKQLSDAHQTVQEYKNTLYLLHQHRLDGNVSLKLSQFGLLLDEDACYRQVASVVERAHQFGQFVRLDMEDSRCTDATIAIYRRLRQHWPNVGIVLQARLFRTLTDARQLADDGLGHIRLCKGIYLEPDRIAYIREPDISNHYLHILDDCFNRGCYVGIATHDPLLIQQALALVAKHGLSHSQYEFQMLYGVAQKLRNQLRDAGHRVRVYVPYGQDWHAYCMRRFQENPQLLGHVLKNLLAA